MFGHGRKYLTALIEIDNDTVSTGHAQQCSLYRLKLTENARIVDLIKSRSIVRMGACVLIKSRAFAFYPRRSTPRGGR